MIMIVMITAIIFKMAEILIMIIMIIIIIIMVIIIIIIIMMIIIMVTMMIIIMIIVITNLFFNILQVIFMRSVTPLSYVYILYTLIRLSLLSAEGKAIDYSFFNKSVLNVLLAVWMVVEAAFFPYYYLVFRRVNKLNHDLEVILFDFVSSLCEEVKLEILVMISFVTLHLLL